MEYKKTKRVIPIKYIPKFKREQYKTFKGYHGIEYAIITECTMQCPFHEVNTKEDYPFCGITLDDVYDELHYNVVGKDCPLNHLEDIKTEAWVKEDD